MAHGAGHVHVAFTALDQIVPNLRGRAIGSAVGLVGVVGRIAQAAAIDPVQILAHEAGAIGTLTSLGEVVPDVGGRAINRDVGPVGAIRAVGVVGGVPHAQTAHFIQHLAHRTGEIHGAFASLGEVAPDFGE